MSKARQLAQKPSQPTGRKNLIINGGMNISQRGTSSTGTAYATVDRIYSSQDGTMASLVTTKEQSSDAPNGFSNSFKITTDTAETVASDDYYYARMGVVEGQDIQHLNYGTSSAKTMSLSFWVKSSETGVYAITNYLHDDNRSYPVTYTINSANTWEYKTITISGDTVGVIDNNNGRGLEIYFLLSAGSNSTGGGTAEQWQAYTISHFAKGHTADVAGTANATWQITGVQLEVGSTATEFEHRSYGEELALCQRYYQVIDVSGVTANRWKTTYGNIGTLQIHFPTEMRADGSFSSLTTLTSRNLYNMATDVTVTSGGMQAAVNFDRDRAASLYVGSAGGSLGGGSGDPMIISGGSETLFAFDAEL